MSTPQVKRYTSIELWNTIKANRNSLLEEEIHKIDETFNGILVLA